MTWARCCTLAQEQTSDVDVGDPGSYTNPLEYALLVLLTCLVALVSFCGRCRPIVAESVTSKAPVNHELLP